MGRSSSTSSRRPTSLSNEQKERLEPQLLRAAEYDDTELLGKIIEEAKAKAQLNENFLRIALLRSSEKGTTSATRFLLEQGASPDAAAANRPSPLLRAIERDHVAIVKLLLEHNANVEVADKKGRTALMTAAWKNRWHILKLLIARGADVNKKDLRGRNVLHNLAADKQCDWGEGIINLLLDEDVQIDGPKGQDELRRTPLHWACATGKMPLAEQLLTRHSRARANVHAVEIRGKTSLHIAATHLRDDIVELLLAHGADVNAKSDGGWTPLHSACEKDKGSEHMVRILLDAGADINAKLLNGTSPLHLAAQAGNLEVVKCLLECKCIKRALRDAFGITPFLRAAQHHRNDVVRLLAPFNQVETLSEDALGACNGFNATIVDFGKFRHGNVVIRRTVYELLYGRDPGNPRNPAFLVKSENEAANFRWIHLPANNMAWVEALLTKAFVEEGSHDVDGFKALEKSFSNQHRGQQSHSHFMRPVCQRTARASRLPEEPLTDKQVGNSIPAIVVNGETNANNIATPQAPAKDNPSTEDKSDKPKSPLHRGGKENSRSSPREKNRKPNQGGPTKQPKNESHNKDQRKPHGAPRSHSSGISPQSGRREAGMSPKDNIYTFLPYLHFESDSRRQEMQQAIKKAEMFQSSPSRHFLTKASTFDEMLIRAHLASSTVSLHVRRTLDQSYYHNIDTQSRDQDQVVYRYQTKGKDPNELDPNLVNVFMVDQLWMWILGKDLIVTSFPQRWQQPKNDPLNVLDSIIEDINSASNRQDEVKSVYDLAMIITSRCIGVFDRHRMGDEKYQFLDMFESSIGNATERESLLFKEFNVASEQASAWLQHNQRRRQYAKYSETVGDEKTESLDKDLKEKKLNVAHGPLFVDKLLDIGQETNLLAETKDIRDELNMISKVLEDQLQVLPDLQDAICDIFKNEQRSQYEVKRRFREQTKTIETHIKDLERMDKQAERIYSSITDMLDLKQKHANAFEARFAHDQAAGTARQGQTIMVFTIVTIIFLPLSFIAAVFTINVAEFPHDDNGTNLPLAYVSRYMFGIGFAISIPLIVVALTLEDIVQFFKRTRRRVSRRKVKRELQEETIALDLIRMEQALSVARSNRRSFESQWAGRHLSPGLRSQVAEPPRRGDLTTNFRMRISQDLERGVYR